MYRMPLLNMLENHISATDLEETFRQNIIVFAENEPNCFERTLLKGHITGSAFIVNLEKTKTLLVKHAKLNRWLQPGGHCDGESNVANVAKKETEEETGLVNFEIDESKIFDVDIHIIPERKGIPEHLHYDIRFLIMTDEKEKILISDESTDLRWINISEIEDYTLEESILRMVRKLH